MFLSDVRTTSYFHRITSSTIDRAAHSMPLNSLAHCRLICTATIKMSDTIGIEPSTYEFRATTGPRKPSGLATTKRMKKAIYVQRTFLTLNYIKLFSIDLFSFLIQFVDYLEITKTPSCR